MEQLLQSLNSVYMTLGQIDIKGTPLNTKYLCGVYSELEKCMKLIQEVGDKDAEREGE